jgi:hypothetical protein
MPHTVPPKPQRSIIMKAPDLALSGSLRELFTELSTVPEFTPSWRCRPKPTPLHNPSQVTRPGIDALHICQCEPYTRLGTHSDPQTHDGGECES